ncbi:MAG: glycerophosphodiester phosphodiesterase [Oligoflexia bacterium]|nr:glycerophosphodiester phosphodiesterase [Oligoflexia bacterium]
MKNNLWYLNRPIAHRGYHNNEVCENSLGSFELAMEKDFPIEFDLRLTSDGEVVVFHDINTVRVTGASFDIQEMSYEQLKKLKLTDGQDIPRLIDVLNLVQGKVPLVIELKTREYDGKLEKKVYDLLKDYRGEYAIQAFHPRTLLWFKKRLPHIPRGMLSGTFNGIDLESWKKIVLRNLLLAPFIKPDYIGLEQNCLDEVSPKLVKFLKDTPIVAWTIRSFDEYKQVYHRCDNVIFENFDPSI